MAGSTVGQLFRITIFSEPHELAPGCIADGVPPGIPLTEADLQHDLDHRRPGTPHYTTQRREPDQVKILPSVSESVTTDTSTELLIENTDQRSQDYSTTKDVSYPGHTDYTYEQRCSLRDYYGGGHSSARETAVRVAAGAITEECLAEGLGIEIRGYLTQMGDIPLEIKDWSQVERSSFSCPGPDKINTLDELVCALKKGDDPIGTRITVVVNGVPAELGEPVFDRPNVDITHALMSINVVKGMEIDDNSNVITLRGSQNRDETTKGGFQSNHTDGIFDGISSEQKITAHMALKPTSSITMPGRIINRFGEEVETITKGRHDSCVGIHAVPITEATSAIALMDRLLRQWAQNADVKADIPCW